MLRIFEWRFAENILLRAIGKLVYLVAWIIGLAILGGATLWALKAFGVIDVFATIAQVRAKLGLTDWKKAAGSALGVLFLGWLAWSVLDSPPQGGYNNQQNYYNRRNVTYVDRREMRRMERQQDRRDRSNIDRRDGL